MTLEELIDRAIRHWLWFASNEHCVLCGTDNPVVECAVQSPELRGIVVDAD